MIEYYIDGSTKDCSIGAGIVKVNEFGFIEKHHFQVEHIKPTSQIAEGFSLEKALELIKRNDIDKSELIDIYTDHQGLHQSLLYLDNVDFKRNFFIKKETDNYFNHLRSLYLELISRNSILPIYHCVKTKKARPLVKLFFKDELEDKKYLLEAHTLSRKYIKKETNQSSIHLKAITKDNQSSIHLKAVRKDNKWFILRDNKDIVAENKRPLIALSEALKRTHKETKEIKVCDQLATIIKSTSKNKLSDSMKSAVKIIENHKLLINS